jgi:transcription elongation factor GreA
MTPEGAARLREELRRLQDVDMPAVVKDIATAREHGDLSENAEYHAAKERQGMIHARITHLEHALSRAEIIDPAKLKGTRVGFGARVKLSNVDTGEEVEYFLVGSDEADIQSGRLSITSPLARSLLGHEEGDEVKVVMPAGPRTYEILQVTYG